MAQHLGVNGNATDTARNMTNVNLIIIIMTMIMNMIMIMDRGPWTVDHESCIMEHGSWIMDRGPLIIGPWSYGYAAQQALEVPTVGDRCSWRCAFLFMSGVLAHRQICPATGVVQRTPQRVSCSAWSRTHGCHSWIRCASSWRTTSAQARQPLLSFPGRRIGLRASALILGYGAVAPLGLRRMPYWSSCPSLP